MPNFTKLTYADWLDNTKFDTAAPPYFDDGTAGSLTAFAANTAALASGTGATAGGTENSYPGAAGGVVPASTSVPHEGAGTEVVVTITYPPAYSGAAPQPPLLMVSDLGSYTQNPNAQHASSLSPATNPTLATIAPTTAVSGPSGTTTVTATGVGFTRQSVIYANGVAQPTTFVSSTSLTAPVTKKTSAGTWPITVVTGGVVTTAPQTFTWT